MVNVVKRRLFETKPLLSGTYSGYRSSGKMLRLLILLTCFALYCVSCGKPKDDGNARTSMRRLLTKADRGDAASQYTIGVCYLEGAGAAKDPVEAVKWFRKSADQQYPPAQYAMGVCLYNGDGVQTNNAQAANWITKAAEQDHTAAQSTLANLMASKTIPGTLVLAYKWALLAADNGDKDSQKLAGELGQILVDWDVKGGKEMAQEFRDLKRHPTNPTR